MERELVTPCKQNLMMDKKKTNVVDKLPNEILRMILVKLKVSKLIRLRRVSKRWQLASEDICHEQRSLVIQTHFGQIHSIAKLSKMFNNLVDFGKNFVVLNVRQLQPIKPEYICLSADLCAHLVRLFPHVENLVINSEFYHSPNAMLAPLLNSWAPTIVTLCLPNDYCQLSAHIDKLTELKRLSFYHDFSLKLTTMARLEHFSMEFGCLKGIAPRFGPSLTSLYLDYSRVPGNVKPYKLAPLVLSNLAQLTIVNLRLDLAALVEWVNWPTVPSVRVLSLLGPIFRRGNGDGERFCRGLSTIFPNVLQLTIGHRDVQYVRQSIGQHLGLFVHLRAHSFVLTPNE